MMIVFQYAFEQGIVLDFDQCERIAQSFGGRTITPQEVARAAQADALAVSA